MKGFFSLVKKEWYTYKLWWISLILFAFIFIGLLPPIMEHFLNGEVASGEIRIAILFISMSLLFILPIIQLQTSLSNDIKQKDIWLHIPSNIYTLIGAKLIFILIVLIVTSLFCFIGLFFLGDSLIGSWKQIALFIGFLTFLEVFLYSIFSILFLLIYAIHIQMKRYIGQFSLLISFTLVFTFLWFMSVVPEKYIQIQYGKIPTDWIYNNLPTFKDSRIFVDIEFYSVDLLVSIIFLILCYIGACKWIEKVITR